MSRGLLEVKGSASSWSLISLQEMSGKKDKAEKNESLLREVTTPMLLASQSLQEMRVIEELMHEEVARRDLRLRELQVLLPSPPLLTPCLNFDSLGSNSTRS